MLSSELPIMDTMNNIESVHFTVVESLAADGRLIGPNTVSCNSRDEATAIIAKLSGETPSDVRLNCEGREWVLVNCDLSAKSESPPSFV